MRSSVLEILLEITKFCDLYLMERVLDDESEVMHQLFLILVLLFVIFPVVNFLLPCSTLLIVYRALVLQAVILPLFYLYPLFCIDFLV